MIAVVQIGWPAAKWRALQTASADWQKVAKMVAAQREWRMSGDFPLSDEALRLGAL